MRAMSPDARDALRYAIARLAVDFLSGPNGLASTLRTGLLQPRSARPACRSISATPTTSPPTSAAPSPCATGTAHGPAATDPPATATCTTSCTNKTAAQPASATASCSASSTTTYASTAGTGRSPSTPTAPRPPAAPTEDRSSEATHHRPAERDRHPSLCTGYGRKSARGLPRPATSSGTTTMTATCCG